MQQRLHGHLGDAIGYVRNFTRLPFVHGAVSRQSFDDNVRQWLH